MGNKGCKSKNRGKNKQTIFQAVRYLLRNNRVGDLLLSKGIITDSDLRRALLLQKETSQPLGQILVQQKTISRRQLFWLLKRQSAIRFIAAGILFAASMTSVGNKKVRADIVRDVPAKIKVSNVSPEFTRVAAYPALFGSDEKRSTNLSAFKKWTGMFTRFDRELGGTNGNRVMTQWQNDLRAFQNLPLKTMADRVNTLVNKTRYIGDKKNWGQSDYWATPIEFLQRGGDCEDYAITKYTALRALGVPEERLRIAIVHDTQKNIPHAILIVYTDQGTYFLDNQNQRILDAERAGRYRPIFSINRQAWWLHTAPGATRIASAQ